jgi:hypothetical protein
MGIRALRGSVTDLTGLAGTLQDTASFADTQAESVAETSGRMNERTRAPEGDAKQLTSSMKGLSRESIRHRQLSPWTLRSLSLLVER